MTSWKTDLAEKLNHYQASSLGVHPGSVLYSCRAISIPIIPKNYWTLELFKFNSWLIQLYNIYIYTRLVTSTSTLETTWNDQFISTSNDFLQYQNHLHICEFWKGFWWLPFSSAATTGAFSAFSRDKSLGHSLCSLEWFHPQKKWRKEFKARDIMDICYPCPKGIESKCQKSNFGNIMEISPKIHTKHTHTKLAGRCST